MDNLKNWKKGYAQVTSRLESMLNLPSPGKAIFSFKPEKINAAQAPSWINVLMKNEDESARGYAHDKLNELKGLAVSDQFVIRMDASRWRIR
jgi:hypothetical protein